MKFLEKSYRSPASDLALDEALLEAAEAAGGQGEVLRIWESARPAVVVGRSSKVSREVDLEACAAHEVPIYRRSSGGAAVVIGPGCLMYSIVLSLELRPECRMISQAHCLVMTQLRQALKQLAIAARHQGASDLTVDGKKFSGNSLRCKRHSVLYHGTLLYAFDLALIERCLPMPPRQPAYRDGRSHGDFVTNLPANREALVAALRQQWSAESVLEPNLDVQVAKLVSEKYGQPEWNRRH